MPSPHLPFSFWISFVFNFAWVFVVPREIEDNAYAGFWGANQGVLWKMCTGKWMHSKRCTTTREYTNWGYQTACGALKSDNLGTHISSNTLFIYPALLKRHFFSFIARKSWRSTMSSRLYNGPLVLFRALNRPYYSFKIFPRFWLPKGTSIIHHNKLLMTKFGRILCLARKWRQECSVFSG